MKTITLLGIDLAKEVFELRGVDAQGCLILKRTMKRCELIEFTAKLPTCRIAMEACGGSHYWSRLFRSQGHTPQLIAAQHVKPFKKSRQKNDAKDAEAIVEAALRPNMKYVGEKNLFQQDVQSLLRVRSQYVALKLQVSNQIRGLLMEYGVVLAKSFSQLKKQIPFILEDDANNLTPIIRELLSSQYDFFKKVDQDLEGLEKKLSEYLKMNEDYRRLLGVPGVGPLSAASFIASVGNPSSFKNGRHLSAWAGLVPIQNSSGGKEKLGGITKAGDKHLRATLIHGARALITATIKKQKTDPLSQWILKLHREKGWNRAAVAIANKNVRVMWHLLQHQEEYQYAV